MAQRTALPVVKLEASPQHVEAFKALAHLTRLQVFFFLVREGREVPAGEIQEALEVPGPTLSHHLDILRRAGLVQSRREERYVHYSVRRDTASALVRKGIAASPAISTYRGPSGVAACIASKPRTTPGHGEQALGADSQPAPQHRDVQPDHPRWRRLGSHVPKEFNTPSRVSSAAAWSA